jgi:hypothetical protein
MKKAVIFTTRKIRVLEVEEEAEVAEEAEETERRGGNGACQSPVRSRLSCQISSGG